MGTLLLSDRRITRLRSRANSKAEFSIVSEISYE